MSTEAKGWFWLDLGFSKQEVELMCQEEIVEPSFDEKDLSIIYDGYFEDD